MDPVSQINNNQRYKKIINILQLRFLIRFAQALFNPKGNSSKNLCTLEGIWDITVGQFRKCGPKYPNSWERTYKGNMKVKSSA